MALIRLSCRISSAAWRSETRERTNPRSFSRCSKSLDSSEMSFCTAVMVRPLSIHSVRRTPSLTLKSDGLFLGLDQPHHLVVRVFNGFRDGTHARGAVSVRDVDLLLVQRDTHAIDALERPHGFLDVFGAVSAAHAGDVQGFLDGAHGEPPMR